MDTPDNCVDDSLLAHAFSMLNVFFPIDIETYTIGQTMDYFWSSDSPNAVPGFGSTHPTKAAEIVDMGTALWEEFDRSLDTDNPCHLPPFMARLKQELLKPEKISNKQTRLYLVAHYFHHLSCVRTFGAWHEIFCSGTYPVFNRVGKSEEYGGWHRFIHRLAHDPSGAELTNFRALMGDVSSCDVSIKRTLAKHLIAFFVHKAPSSSRQRVETLLNQAFFSPFVTSRGKSYYRNGSNPSGWFLTIVINTLVVMALTFKWFLSVRYRNETLPLARDCC